MNIKRGRCQLNRMSIENENKEQKKNMHRRTTQLSKLNKTV